MEGSTAFFDTILKNQQEFVDNWMKIVKNYQGNIFSFIKPQEGGGGSFAELTNLYNSWTKALGISIDGMMKNFPMATGKDTAAKMFRGFDAYIKLYDFLSPLLKAIQEKTFDPQSYKDILDPAKFKEVVDKSFGFTSPESMNDMYHQTSKLIETWGGTSQNFLGPWAQAIQKNFTAFADISSAADPDANMNMLHNLFIAFNETFGKAFKVPPVGKDREKIEIVLKAMDAYSDYVVKNTVFQHKMYKSSEKALEKVIEALAAKIKEGADIKSYDELYKIWTDINEKEYFALFNTDEFSKIQGDLLEASLTLRQLNQKLIELYLVDLPVPVRSEMNDVYKTIYELKKKVREIEKKLNEKSKKEGQ
ncbi:MAG: hypothetical protein L3V56_12385 [Candidatus Magnetoovum sp. WYHC-5]|nr:hypothetical protein [Candidatus Magnetoovum sp. WYHC-5]